MTRFTTTDERSARETIQMLLNVITFAITTGHTQHLYYRKEISLLHTYEENLDGNTIRKLYCHINSSEFVNMLQQAITNLLYLASRKLYTLRYFYNRNPRLKGEAPAVLDDPVLQNINELCRDVRANGEVQLGTVSELAKLLVSPRLTFNLRRSGGLDVELLCYITRHLAERSCEPRCWRFGSGKSKTPSGPVCSRRS